MGVRKTTDLLEKVTWSLAGAMVSIDTTYCEVGTTRYHPYSGVISDMVNSSTACTYRGYALWGEC